MIGENFSIRSFILPPSPSSSFTKCVPEQIFGGTERFFDRACVLTFLLERVSERGQAYVFSLKR